MGESVKSKNSSLTEASVRDMLISMSFSGDYHQITRKNMLSIPVLLAEFILKRSYAWLVQCLQKNVIELLQI